MSERGVSVLFVSWEHNYPEHSVLWKRSDLEAEKELSRLSDGAAVAPGMLSPQDIY